MAQNDHGPGPGGHLVGVPGVVVGVPGQDEDQKVAPAVKDEAEKVGPAVQDREHLDLAGGHIDGDHGPGGHVVGVPGVVVGVLGQDEDEIVRPVVKDEIEKVKLSELC